ncbi:hypothetical protein M422DRAFT_192663 [Sphaerobolus stellatus SS14]|uniref:MULE transposase domain-containing protein n=1 Tax=Sphaerobolus stellatus (strain SS14) TaxID=990650 RepID=A0A0C9UKR5_SPHS4|nr:hypothetical protein M422DRAFT_192663 [Sphaerobolus stellatus SS14]
MDRYPCQGKLLITLNPSVEDAFRVQIKHHLPHPHYVDIGLTDTMKGIIEDMKDSSASLIWSRLVREFPDNEVTQSQVHFHWSCINKDAWRLDPDQIVSAMNVLKQANPEEIEIIPMHEEEGISAFSFGLKDVIESFGSEINEIAMDSTWKTNAAGYELYAVVAEAGGRALPLAFTFVTTVGGGRVGAKDRTLQDVLRWIKAKCPNIKFTLSDKDQSEINAFSTVFDKAKHQLCYWHAIRYLEERLGEDRPPASYDGRKAHSHFNFIDPTWVPGITNGNVEPGLSDFTEDSIVEDACNITTVSYFHSI